MGLVRLDGLLFTWILYCTPPKLHEVGPSSSGNTLTYTRKGKNRNGGTASIPLGD